MKGSNKFPLSTMAETEIYWKKKRAYTTLQKLHNKVRNAVKKAANLISIFVNNDKTKKINKTSQVTTLRLSKYNVNSICLSTLHELNKL